MINHFRKALKFASSAPNQPDSLGARVVRGAISVLAGDAYGNILRLLANLLMTRLLFPEAFGLMLIVNLVYGALQMLSDVGIRGALITKRDGIDNSYIDTAWTISIVRGIALCVIALLVAWPVAYAYEEPQLVGLIIVAAFAPLMTGFCSPYPILEEKRVNLGKVIIWKALGQTIAVLATVIWLLIQPTVWALAANGVIAALVLSTTSFLFFKNRLPRLTWNKKAAGEIYRFGRWVFVASALTFFARNANQIVVSQWVTTEILGLFSIAISLAKLVENTTSSITWSLLFPLYAELGENDNNFHRQRLRIKVVMFAVSMLPIVVLSVFGAEVISLLYDERYHGAGWMLEILAVGSVFLVLSASVENIPHAKGNSYLYMWVQFYRGLLMFLAMLCGGYWWGLEGLVISISAGSLLFLPVLSVIIRRYGIKDYLLDTSLIASGLGVIVLGWWIFGFPL